MKIRSFFVGVVCACLLVAGAASAADEVKFSAKEPALLTSAGQSADILMLKVLLEKNNISIKINPLAQPKDLQGIKTLVIAVGGSTKGLGAAGLDAEKEHARVTVLLEKAKKEGIPVLAMLVGGQARRGAISDGFIAQAIPAASYVISVKEGDEDGFITKTAANAKVNLLFVNRISEVGSPLKAIFKK